VRAPFSGVFATSVLMTLAPHMSVRHPMSPVVAKLPIQVFDCFSQNKGEQKDLIKIPTYFTYAKPTSTNFIYFFNFLM
jgi:hypothetical protein